MRVLVTRPRPQADDWVDRLRAAGVDAVALPLIEIAGPSDPSAVDAAWADLASRDLAVFVSPNAALRFFVVRPAGMAWPAATLAAAPGPGTARVLARLGVPAPLIVEPPADALQFDSRSLWPVLAARRDWAGRRVRVVRGDGGRDELAALLRGHGAQVDAVAAYARRAPDLEADPTTRGLLAAALQRPADHAWLFSSSQAIEHLLRALPDATASRAPSHALATHPRIAARARAAGFGRVHETTPALAAVVACLQSIAT
ncbi:MAG: uroporphyrinogen-III synthase [Burkholderiaceae bacterium]